MFQRVHLLNFSPSEFFCCRAWLFLPFHEWNTLPKESYFKFLSSNIIQLTEYTTKSLKLMINENKYTKTVNKIYEHLTKEHKSHTSSLHEACISLSSREGLPVPVCSSFKAFAFAVDDCLFLLVRGILWLKRTQFKLQFSSQNINDNYKQVMAWNNYIINCLWS
jgi:hypothetical protein